MKGLTTRLFGISGLLATLLAALVLLLPFASSCNGSGPDTAGKTSAEVDASTDTSGAAEPLSVEGIRDEVARIRGLPARDELNVSYINREQLAGEMEAELDESYPVEEAAVEAKVLKQLNLIDQDTDLVEAAQQMLTEDVLGYYDDQTGELKVVSETEEIDPLNEITLAHEITHALQDQNFSLTRLLPSEGSGNDDRDLALLSLVEGDATLTDQEYAAANMGVGDAISLLMETIGATSGLGTSYLDDSLSFPYLNGAEFVSALRQSGGWEAVNAAYAAPPQSTEQILHPRKYLEGEAPIDVSMPDLGSLLGGGWSRTYSNVAGEFDLREMLGVGLPAREANGAAAGWGGGGIELYEDQDGRQLLALVLVWDSEDEADEFTLAMAENLEVQTGSAFVFREDSLPFMDDGYRSWVMVQRGRSSVIISAPDTQLGERAVRQILGP